MRIAEASGNEEVARDWEQRAYIYRQSRHRRRMELLQLAIQAPKAVATTAAAGTGVLLLSAGCWPGTTTTSGTW